MAWLAALALALVPTLSRSLAGPQPELPWMALCTAAGMVQADPDRAGGGPAAGHLDHCGLCLVAAGPLAPPASAPPAIVAAAAHLPAATPVSRARPAAPSWRSPPPRGPPARA